jgi:hypothetical protein
MAKDIQPVGQSQVAAAQHFIPPTTRELRAHAVHRLQIGLFGLATMLLIVGLANIIMDRARQADVDNGVVKSAESAAPVRSDPLADIGVVPASDPSAAAPVPAKTGN